MEMDPMDSEHENERIARRIAAGQERNRARSALRGVAEEHPIALLAGGLLLGALVARFMPKSVFGKLGSRAAALTMAGAEMATLFGGKVATAAGDVTREGREKLEELGESVSESTAGARRTTSNLADIAISTAKAVGSDALRRVSEAADRVRH